MCVVEVPVEVVQEVRIPRAEALGSMLAEVGDFVLGSKSEYRRNFVEVGRRDALVEATQVRRLVAGCT